MFVPSLFRLTCNQVVENFTQREHVVYHFKLHPSLGNVVLEELCKKAPKHFPVAAECLMVSRACFQKQEPMTPEHVRFLVQQNYLQVLNLGFHLDDEEEYAHDGHPSTIEFLERCVNESSRKKLCHIGFGNFTLKKDIDQTVQKMSRDYPNVTSLDINYCSLETESFFAICDNFPHLKRLGMRATRVTSLKGISKLTQLEVLTIGHLNFDNEDEFRELCTLEHLKVLDAFVGDFQKFARALVEREKPLPVLRELDCTASDMIEADFDIIQTAIPSLRLICIAVAEFEVSRLQPRSNLKVLSDENLSQVTETVQYYRGSRKTMSVEILIREVVSDFSRFRNHNDAEVTRQLFREVVEELRDGHDICAMRWIWQDGLKMLDLLCTSFIAHFTAVEFNIVFDLYHAPMDRDNPRGEFWETWELHKFYWSCLSELCKRNTLNSFNQDLGSVLDECIEVLRMSTDTFVRSTVYGFLQEVFRNPNYSELYDDFIAKLELAVNSSVKFCVHYAENRMIEPLLCHLRFVWRSREEEVRIKTAHLKMLKKVVTRLRDNPPMEHICRDTVVAYLLNIISAAPNPLDELGHYAFAILWIEMESREESVHKQAFELLKLRKPLRKALVLQLIDDPREEELLNWVNDEPEL